MYLQSIYRRTQFIIFAFPVNFHTIQRNTFVSKNLILFSVASLKTFAAILKVLVHNRHKKMQVDPYEDRMFKILFRKVQMT